MEIQECMIATEGKLNFAIKLNANAAERDSGRSYLTIQHGKVHFSSSFFTTHSFDVGNESHRIAKEIFVSQLQTDIKTRILELKQLESVFRELGLEDLFAYEEARQIVGSRPQKPALPPPKDTAEESTDIQPEPQRKKKWGVRRGNDD